MQMAFNHQKKGQYLHGVLKIKERYKMRTSISEKELHRLRLLAIKNFLENVLRHAEEGYYKKYDIELALEHAIGMTENALSFYEDEREIK
jgi:hypothetical protein